MDEKYMLSKDSLKGRIILITGGGTGLGKEMARSFLSLGARVVICSRKEEVLSKTTRELSEETGGEIIYFSCDIRNNREVETMVDKTIAEWGVPDTLINNAAGNFISPTERLSVKAFDIITDIVLKGSYNCTLTLGKHWIKESIKANVLSIVTTYAWTGSGYVVPSACAKAGVLALTRSLAAEWGHYGIRLNAIAPGPVPTKGAFSRLFPGASADLIDPVERIPVGRFGKPEEIANLASYLISDYAGYVNGEVVTIDGGEWLKGVGEFNLFSKIPAEKWDEIENQVRKANKS